MEIGRRAPDYATASLLEQAARCYFTEWGGDRLPTPWAGSRPLTPNGLPLIGQVAEGLYVASGHGMLGITLGPRTGEALAAQVVTGHAPPELAAFAPLRARSR